MHMPIMLDEVMRIKGSNKNECEEQRTCIFCLILIIQTKLFVFMFVLTEIVGRKERSTIEEPNEHSEHHEWRIPSKSRPY